MSGDEAEADFRPEHPSNGRGGAWRPQRSPHALPAQVALCIAAAMPWGNLVVGGGPQGAASAGRDRGLGRGSAPGRGPSWGAVDDPDARY